MQMNLKARKCRRCKAEFAPKTEWQKYCSARCRWTVGNNNRLALVRRARQMIEKEAANG